MSREVETKLVELSKRVKASMHVAFNPHKAFYEDAAGYYTLRDMLSPEQIESTNFDKDIWTLQVYFHTPIGFYFLIGNDLEALVDEALAIEVV